MKLNILIASRPVLFLILLALLVLIPPSIVITCWYKTTKQIEYNVYLNSHHLYSEVLSQIDTIAKSIPALNSSATTLSRLLSSSLNQTDQISFDEIETKVAPVLFLAFSTIPYVSQISYAGLEGLFFSYYIDGYQIRSAYAKPMFSSNRMRHVWYKQPVDNESGKLYGKAVRSHAFDVVNTSWFQAALNNSCGYSSVEKGWNNAADPLFVTSVSLLGREVISIGVPVKRLTNLFSGLDLYGGSLSLITMDGKLLLDGIPNTTFIYANNSIFLRLMKPNGTQNVSCTPRNDTLETYTLNIGEKEYSVSCSPVEIYGVQSVYALASPHEGLASLVHSKINHSHIALVVTIALFVIPLVFFVSSMGTTAQREIRLHDKLIKQMEATQQAERKSMNKSLALVDTSHEIRGSLSNITGLIESILTNASPGFDIEWDLNQMSSCAQELLALLNSILDTSKIEAGRMNLEEQEFNLAELIEHVVDVCHTVCIPKGVDVVLDSCDGSINKLSQVKGDRGKILQILCNLLNNAVKFTPEGHIALRAWVEKPDFDTEILASRRNGYRNLLPRCIFPFLFDENNEDGAIRSVGHNPNSVEIVFEVDDTGKGIPKEKQQSVFENYVQVKETAAGQVGTGLGLGIVQSLVRLMGGEIGIVDKEIGEKGTCFRFNVFLTSCEAMSGGTKPYSGLIINTPSPSLAVRTPSPKLEASQLILFMQNNERRKVSHKFMQGLGISVSVVDQCNYLTCALKEIQFKLNPSSTRSDMSCRIDISSSSSKDMPLSAMEGTDHKLAFNRRRDAPSFILLVIDVNTETFSELWKIVAEFRRGLPSTCCCKVIWLDKPNSHSVKTRLDPGDEIMLQPFHGSRLYRVIKLLPEFGAPSSSQGVLPRRNEEIQEYASSSDDSAQSCNEKPLIGKRILIAEDNSTQRRLATAVVKNLGAEVESCKNGNEALELVCNGLKARRNDLPYDYILMDCQMSPINGYKATRRIRKEEEQYGVHIPIIALTAHTDGTDAKKAGMDAHLVKHLKGKELMEAIQYIQRRNIG